MVRILLLRFDARSAPDSAPGGIRAAFRSGLRSVTRAVIAAFTANSGSPGLRLPRAPGPAAPGRRAAPPGLASLTEREKEVVGLVACGLSNDEIARELVVSPLTAKTHVSRAMTKLNARDRAQLVVLAYEHGLTAS
jgi:DNA-binding NarL/FixJ family response regulator